MFLKPRWHSDTEKHGECITPCNSVPPCHRGLKSQTSAHLKHSRPSVMPEENFEVFLLRPKFERLILFIDSAGNHTTDHQQDRYHRYRRWIRETEETGNELPWPLSFS